MGKTTVLLVDDQILFIESLKTVIETIAEDIEVTGLAHSGEEAMQCIAENTPDIVLLDVRMPGMNGVDTMKLICREYPQVKVMMLTTFDDDEYVHEALEHGAAGYLLKDVPPTDLINSIRAMEAGTVQVSPQVFSILLDRQSGVEYEQALAKIENLSDRELEVLGHLAEGLNNIQISDRMFITEQTVKNHISKIYAKLGIHDRRAVMKLGITAGLDKKYRNRVRTD